MSSESACRLHCTPNSRTRCSASNPTPSGRLLFAGIPNDLRRVAIRRFTETNQTFAANLHRVTANERFFAVLPDDERAVRTLIDQHELIAIELHAGMQSRYQVTLDDQIILFGPAQGDA